MSDAEQEMTTTITERKASLEAAMSRVAGFPVELTIRGDRWFTASATGERDFAPLVRWLKSGKAFTLIRCEAEYDSECDLSCLFFDVA